MTDAALKTRTVTIDSAAMVAYAGATWDHHKLHHDAAYAESLGLPGTVVDGQLFGAFFATAAREHAPSTNLVELSFRFRSMVFAGETVTVTGTVVADDDRGVVIDHAVHVDDRLCVTGTSRSERP